MHTSLSHHDRSGRADHSPRRRRLATRALPVIALAAAMFFADLPASTAASWGDPTTAPIHPGVQMYTPATAWLDGSAECTANFVFADATAVYIGQAAHCSSTGSDTDLNGCTTGSLPLGTPVALGTDYLVGGLPGPAGPVAVGTMVYNSWLAMQAAHETNADACQFNDFALIRLPSSVSPSMVNPSVPVFGGPTGLASATTAFSAVYSYGNSLLRAGVPVVGAKVGVSSGSNELPDSSPWTQQVYTASPGIPGDSGSGFLDDSGRAFGVLTSLEALPCPGSNGVGSLALELSYMASHNSSLSGVHLVNGTQPFAPPSGQSSPIAC